VIEIVPTNDWPRIRALAGEIWREYYPGILAPEPIEYMLQWRYSDVALSEDDAEYYLVKRGGESQGFIGLGRENADVKLHKLYLRQESRGQGLGARSLAFVLERARELSAGRLVLNVHKRNTQAIKAYERAGFMRVDSVVIPIAHGFTLDDYIYAKTV